VISITLLVINIDDPHRRELLRNEKVGPSDDRSTLVLSHPPPECSLSDHPPLSLKPIGPKRSRKRKRRRKKKKKQSTNHAPSPPLQNLPRVLPTA
jgi:hypothetical protein